MSDCDLLLDRMPLVALGRADWTPAEEQHLSGCESCQLEWRLLRVASQLGEQVGRSIDGAAAAGTLLDRIKQERKFHPYRRRSWAFAPLVAAAAIAAVVWSDRPMSTPAVSAPISAALAGRSPIPLPELENLQPTELDSVLQTMDAPADSTLDPGNLNDLDYDELQQVLNTWEG